jgi:membrane protein YdbS with pleckstrin-like domain
MSDAHQPYGLSHHFEDFEQQTETQSLGMWAFLASEVMFFGAVFALVLPFVSYRVNRKTYERTEYTFYPDKLDYYEGFFTVEEKTIALHRVTEVNLRKGIFQSKHGLGTILLSTPATSAGTGRASAGIRIHDVENPDENYQRIKELVERSQLPRHRMAA